MAQFSKTHQTRASGCQKYNGHLSTDKGPRHGNVGFTGHCFQQEHKSLLKSHHQQGNTSDNCKMGKSWGPAFPPLFPPAFPSNPTRHHPEVQNKVTPTAPALIWDREKPSFAGRGKQALTDHGGAPSQCSLGPLEEIISRRHALLWHLEAGVDVDPSRNHHPAVGFDGFHSPWHDQVLPYLPGERGFEEQVRHRQVSSL